MTNYFDEQNFDESSFSKLLPLKPSEFINCTFTLIDFTKSNLTSCKFIESHFKSCNLSNVTLLNAVVRDTQFNQCKLMGINWALVKSLSAPSFNESVLDYAVFQSLNLSGVGFKNCSDYLSKNKSNKS